MVAAVETAIPPDEFPPYWRDALDDMLESYERRCSYLALYIEHATGSPTVDHVIPKSRAWDQIYEWSNYRLCAALINSAKGNLITLVDPFAVRRGWFALEFVGFQVVPGPRAPASRRKRIDATLYVLNLPECLKARAEYVVNYERGPQRGGIDLPYLERRAPFIAGELRRQGRLLRGDT